MQHFWHTIKKVKDSESYEFLLANKKYIVDAEVFRKILDICPRVEGEEFTPVQDDDDTLTFLTDLGYKGPLYKHTNIENVNYLELIWEDFAFQIDQRKEKKSRRKTMPFPRFTKVIINHFLKQHKSLTNLKYQHYHTIKDDGIVSRLKFVRIGEDYHEYRLAIPDVMLNDTIIQSESYNMFIEYSTESEPEPAKKRMASRRVVKKKVTILADDNIILDPEVALKLGKSISITEAEEEEAARQVPSTHARIVTESVPEPAKKKTDSRGTRSVVIQDTPIAPKSKPATSKPKLKGVQSLTPEEQEAVDVMQALKESKKTSSRQPGTGGSSEGSGRIPGVPDESTVVSAISSEGTGTKTGVPNEEKVSTKEKIILDWGSEQESEYSEEDLNEEEEINWIDSEEDDEKKDDTDDDKSIDLEMTDDEETDDEVLQGKEQVNDDKDEEMTNDEVEDSGKGDAEISDVAKADAEKIEEAKDDSKKAELPPTSSSLSVSLGFGDQFLKLSSDTSLIGTVKDTIDVEISSLLDIKIQSEVPHIQSSFVLKVPVSMIFEPSVLTPEQETPSAAPVTTLPPLSVSTIPPAPLQQSTTLIPSPPITTDAPIITTAVPESDVLSAVQLRIAKLEKDVFELNKIDHSAKVLATLKSQVPTVVEQYLGSKIDDDLQKVLQRHTADLIQKYSVKPALESSKIQTLTINLEQESEKVKAALKEYDQKSVLYQTMHKNKSFNRNPANHRLYHALIEALIEDENAIDKGVANTVKDHKRNQDDDDDEDPPAGPNQGSKAGKSASAKEPVEEPIAEVVIDDAGEDVVCDDDQP
ncbi:hypothetical protein Tco_0595323 [Tanacetum coccineum]